MQVTSCQRFSAVCTLNIQCKSHFSIAALKRSEWCGWTTLAMKLNTHNCGLTRGFSEMRWSHQFSLGTFFSNLPTTSRAPTRYFSPIHHARRYLSTTSPCTGKQTYYDDLEVDSLSTSREIKEAFYRLSKLHHPDTNVDNPESLKKFQSISEAYEVLSNPRKRASYDKGVLGRNSSVAEQEMSSHRFDKESFYGSRSDRSMSRSNNLDTWVTEQRSRSFRNIQEMKSKRAPGGSSRNSFEHHRIHRRNEKTNASIGSSAIMLLLIILVLYKIVS